MGEAATLVFFDCEATGLSASRLTELSLVAVHKDEWTRYTDYVKKTLTTKDKKEGYCIPAKYPRVMNKLTLAVNPMKQIPLFVEDLTGLNNYNLEAQRKFRDGPAITLASFLCGLEAPVCLVAHNGKKFDFPLLIKEMEKASDIKLPEDLLCCDSWLFFRQYFLSVYNKTDEYKPEIRPSFLAKDSPLKDCSSLLTNTPTKTTQEDNSPFASQLDSLDLHLESSPFLNTPTKSPSSKIENSNELNTPEKQLSNAASLEILSTPPPSSAKKRLNSAGPEEVGIQKIAKLEGSSAIVQRDDYYGQLKILPPAYSLIGLHQHLFGCKPVDSHGAEVDTLALLKVIAVTGKSFTQYVKNEAVLLKDIPQRK